MANGSELLQVTGEPVQLTPESEQVTPQEVQPIPGQALGEPPVLAEPDKRTPPIPDTGAITVTPSYTPAQIQALQTARIVQGWPVLKLNRYTGTDKEWQELIRWEIPLGRTGDLHQLSLLSSNDAKTRYQVVLANIDQTLPLERQTSTPWDAPWRDTVIPGESACYVLVRSTDGTSITVDGMMSGTEH